MRVMGVWLGVAAAWAVARWPMPLHMADRVPGNIDALFSVWRLAWVPAALADPDLALWDPPIFHPAARVLARSDALLLPGVASAPLAAAGLGPITVFNVVASLAAMTSAFGAATLVRQLTGAWGPGVVAGVVFALNQHQGEHVERLELQVTAWVPLLFLCWHRALDGASARWAAAAMACVAAQWLCGMYIGLFLLTALPCLLLTWTWVPNSVIRRRLALAALASLAAALVVIAAASWPYVELRAEVGDRPASETRAYSATLRDFVTVHPRHALYDGVLPRALPERSLFPGFLAPVLAMAGLAATPRRLRLLYVAVALLGLELAMGMNGWLYPALREQFAAFRGIRAPARAVVLAMLALAVFAGAGADALLRRIRPGAARAAVTTALVAAIALEGRLAPNLWTAPAPSPRQLSGLGRAEVVAEFPMPAPERMDATVDTFYMVERIGSWPRLVNGYSGSFPASYVRLLNDARGFPDRRAIVALRRLGVTRVAIHEAWYRDRFAAVLEAAVDQPALVPVGRYRNAHGEVAVFAMSDAPAR